MPANAIKFLFDKYDNDISKISNILDDEILKKLYTTYKDFIPLTHMIKYKRDYIYNSTNIIEKIYDSSTTDISDNSYKIENALFEVQLRNISESDKIYIYTQINITNFIINKFPSKNLEDFYGKVYKPYFYGIQKSDLKSIISKNILVNYNNIIEKYTKLDYYIKILDLFDKYEINEGIEDINIDISPRVINIRTKLNFPLNYSFLELFNNINLSRDIPFTKYRDNIASDIVFKIFKDITYSKDVGYLPDVSMDQLNNWIKYKGFEIDNFKVKPIKSNPREIFFKIKLETFYSNNLLYGMVENQRESDGRIFYDIKVGNEIIADIDKELANVLPKDEDILTIDKGSEVKFFQKITSYADIEIYKKGILNISVNAELYSNEDYEIIINKIISALNKFINTIFEEDRHLVQYQQFKKQFSLNDFLNNNIYLLSDYSEHNVYKNNSLLVTVENSNKLNWYNLYELL